MLMKVRDHWYAWFKNVGDKERIHIAQRQGIDIAKEMSDARYTWLTQDFEPLAPAFKRPNAPWDSFLAEQAGPR